MTTTSIFNRADLRNLLIAEAEWTFENTDNDFASWLDVQLQTIFEADLEGWDAIDWDSISKEEWTNFYNLFLEVWQEVAGNERLDLSRYPLDEFLHYM